MAKIATYAIDATPTLNDKVIGTNVDNENVTLNYKIGDIVALAPGGGSSVQSVNSLTGALEIQGAGGITVSASGTTITLTGGSGSGTVTDVTAQVPLASSGGTAPEISIQQAGTASDGYLSSSDWNKFNNSTGGSPGGSVSNVQYHGTGGVFEGNQYNTYVLGAQHSNHTLGGKEKAGQVTLDTYGTGDAISYGNAALQHRAGTYVHLAGCTSQEASEEYYIYFPQIAPKDNQILESDGLGQLTWINTPSGGGGVSGVSGTAPVDVTSGTTPVVSMAVATDKIDGYLSSTDYNTFNDKQGALTLTTQNTSGAATLTGNTLNIPQYTGSSGPGGSPTQIQYNNSGTLAGDAKFTLVPSSTLTTVTIGDSTSPSVSYGLLKLTGNGSSEGGKIQLETGSGKASPVFMTLQAPAAGVAQTISLPDAVPTADTMILGIKSISGTTVQTQWETPSGGGGAVTTVTTNGSTGAATLNGGVLNIPNYTFGNGITFIGTQKTIGTQQIANNALTLISFGNDTVFKNNDPDFGTIETETDSQGVKASEIAFSGAASIGNYWIVMNVNFESGTADEPVMYAEIEGSPNSQKLVEMTTEVLPANGSTNKHNYYKCFRYSKSGADKQTVHLQVFFPAKSGFRGQTIAIPSPISGMAQAPAASIEIWKN